MSCLMFVCPPPPPPPPPSPQRPDQCKHRSTRIVGWFDMRAIVRERERCDREMCDGALGCFWSEAFLSLSSSVISVSVVLKRWLWSLEVC